MGLKDKLLKQNWKSFERYPKQGENVWISCNTVDGEHWNFMSIGQFNAVTFNPKSILSMLTPGLQWRLGWIYAKELNE